MVYRSRSRNIWISVHSNDLHPGNVMSVPQAADKDVSPLGLFISALGEADRVKMNGLI